MAEEDYMGDLSLFLPPASSPAPSKKKSQCAAEPPRGKLPKGLDGHRRRLVEREQREDEHTAAALDVAIPSTNVGFKLLRQMGYSPGSGLGRGGAGRAEPIGIKIRRSRAGIGAETLAEARARRQREGEAWKKRMQEEMTAEFGSLQKVRWRSRRVVADYRKAEAALVQLENREIVEKTEEEKGEDGEEEEEVITEENLTEVIMKLRSEYRYCLYCGYQYPSMEALLTDCPGPDEDVH